MNCINNSVNINLSFQSWGKPYLGMIKDVIQYLYGFVHKKDWSTQSTYSVILILFWYQGNNSFIKWVWMPSIFSKAEKGLGNMRITYFFSGLVELTIKPPGPDAGLKDRPLVIITFLLWILVYSDLMLFNKLL